MHTERVLSGRYRLLEELGAGGMGAVWRARDELLGRDVAVKEVRVSVPLDGQETAQLHARLEREGRATARISHRNVIAVHDVLTADGRPWIVMELVPGRSLAEVLAAEETVVPRRAAAVGAEVLSALRVAHAAQVVHRDVKPGNVLIANDGRVVLTDFGMAMVRGTSSLTLIGELLGSPDYLAPERALGREPEPASDLWSLGVLLYTAVEGRPPFQRSTALTTLRAVVEDELPPPQQAGPLAPVLEGLLRKAPQERLTARQAEHMLRIAAAGGTPRPAVPPPPSDSPFTPAAPTAPAGVPNGVPAPAAGLLGVPWRAPEPSAPGERISRDVVWVALGALIAALTAAVLVWVLLS